ncbi:MAG: alpha/beta hydrolase [Proteobacteria bacterium]|nr:alpha/beta hydrolase [Pseudomonadota bacterium]
MADAATTFEPAEDKKPALVLVPGLICTGDLWAFQIAALKEVTAITVVDHRAAGSLSELAAQILDDQPGPFALAGHSMGGYVAFEVMRQAGDRVTKLALIATSARQDTLEMAARRRDFIKLAQRGKFRGVSPLLMKTFIHEDALDNKALRETVYRMAHKTGAEGFIRQSEIILERPDSRGDLANISCPTLVLCGDADERTPPALAGEMAAGIADSELVILPRCGHLPQLERPAATTRALKAWLDVE